MNILDWKWIWMILICILILLIVTFFSKDEPTISHPKEGMTGSNPVSNPFLSPLSSLLDTSTLQQQLEEANRMNQKANENMQKSNDAASKNQMSTRNNGYSAAAQQPLSSTPFTINTESSFINFINEMFSNMQIKNTNKTKDISGNIYIDEENTNHLRMNYSNSINTISTMFPAFQSLINQDFNKLSNNYPNLIQSQDDVNHLLGLYFSSNAIYQYMNNVLPPNTDASTVLNLPGNEAKYNSQIGIYENFCTHILYFYEKNLSLTSRNNVKLEQNNPDVEGIEYTKIYTP